MASAVQYSKDKIALIDPKMCVISQLNARQNENRDADAIARLAESIRANGQEQPGLVRKVSGTKFEVLVGGNRLEAVKLLNASLGKGESPYTFKAVIIDVDDQTALIRSIAENEFRQAMNLADRAEAMKRLSDMGLKNVEIAQHFGVDKSEVTQVMKFFALPKKVQKAVAKGQVADKTALVLATLTDDKAELETVFEEAIKQQEWIDSTIAESAEEINALEETPEGEAAPDVEPPSENGTGKKKAGKKERGAHKKGQVSTKAVVAAAKKVGTEKTKNKAAEIARPKKTYKQFEKTLEAIVTDKECPSDVKVLVRRVEEWFYEEASDLQLKNALYKACGQASK